MFFPFDQPAEQCAGPITALAILHKMYDCGHEHVNLVVEDAPLKTRLFQLLFSRKAATARRILVRLAALYDEKYGVLLNRAFHVCTRLHSASRLRSLAFLNNILILSSPFLRDLEPYWTAVGDQEEIRLIKRLVMSPAERGCLSELYPIEYPSRGDMTDCSVSSECPSMKLLAESIYESATSSGEEEEEQEAELSSFEEVVATMLPGIQNEEYALEELIEVVEPEFLDETENP